MVADAPPVISSITPKSHVIRETGGGSVRGHTERLALLTEHCGDQDDRGEEDVSLHVEGLVREEVMFDDLAFVSMRA